ncbi:MAG: 8-amino-7-oxononanoate synthase [Verrucomicrobiae bacterium]|nr:8-amino-7-oxononanoate synthase [Verrucomicrobiae bacterium]NNJ87037.1 8-amino-7-oxononanoate synthase [Akkermansiaceae bacterium]
MRSPEDELAELEQASLRRHLPVVDQSLLNFASNDYLGLAQHPQIKQVYQQAITQYGVGSTASRLICGTMEPHQKLESAIAEAKQTESAISFATGYATAVGVIGSLMQKGDTVILDKLCHASLIDGARLSGATLRVFPHNHLGKLESLLKSTANRLSANSRTLVITESVFSMDGDTAPLREIAELTRAYNGLLLVDEAHALGVIGPTGMGLAEQLGLQDQIDFHMGTLGKAAGVAGGYVASSQAWIDLIVNRARSLIYSTAPPPAQAAAAAEALRILQSDEGNQLRKKLWNHIRLLNQKAESAIIPWHVGRSEDALALSAKLRDAGLLVPAIRYPTVPRNTARLRITISAAHDEGSIQKLARLIQQASELE